MQDIENTDGTGIEGEAGNQKPSKMGIAIRYAAVLALAVLGSMALVYLVAYLLFFA